MNSERIAALYLQPAPLFGGAERQASMLASLLPQFGIDVLPLVGPGPLIANWIEERGVTRAIQTRNFPGGWPRQRGISRLAIPLRYLTCGVRARSEIAEQVERHRIDVIIASLGFAWVTGALVARDAGIPIVWRAGGARINPLQKAALWSVARFLSPDCVWCVSEAVKQTIGPLVPAPAVVVQNGVDHRMFHPGAGNAARYRPPEAERVIGCAGRLTSGKRPEDFIALAARLQSAHPGARFLLGGDGTRREELERLAQERHVSNVVFLGFVSDMPSFFAACDIVVLPSSEEGFSNFALEAMAMGVPLVAADVKATSEVTGSRENAMLYPLGAVDELTHRVNLLLMRPDLRQAYHCNALNWVRRFDVRTSAETIAELLTSLVVERRTKVGPTRRVLPMQPREAWNPVSLHSAARTSGPHILEQGPPSRD